jgi:hypothetical protein
LLSERLCGRYKAVLMGDDDVTIYVYKLRGQRTIAPSQAYSAPWFGLTADTEDELHPFAEMLGLYRRFYKPPTPDVQHVPGVGHYDLDEGEHDRAVANGAQSITARKLDRLYRPLP